MSEYCSDSINSIQWGISSSYKRVLIQFCSVGVGHGASECGSDLSKLSFILIRLSCLEVGKCHYLSKYN